MGIHQSLYTGVTGLSVNADGMSVVANNLANANAKGFKKDRAEFEDMLSMDLSTGSGSGQIGRGSRLKDVRTMFTQGGLAVTDNLSDLAIQGEGFFVLSNPNTEVQESNGNFFTRVGSFIFDKDGYLADSAGGRVQGYLVNEDNLLSTRLTDMRIETNSIPPESTKLLNLNVNLDARETTLEEPFDLMNPEKTSNFNSTYTVFDSHGRSHMLTMFFRRTEDSGDGIGWEWRAAIDSKEVADPGEGEYKEVGNGVVRFDSKGNLLEEITNEFEINFAGGAKPAQQIVIDFGKNVGEEGGTGLGASTSLSSASITQFHKQDGFEAGNIKSLRIDMDGSLTGIYTNGIQRKLGAVALATFENQNGLVKAGRNQFYGSIHSGPPKIGMAQTATRGSIYASSLEESNVDMAQEFVNMIMAQRGFQANSRSITTADSMIEEIVNLKR
jgi:flagellar hook protein FlgE